MAPDDVNRKQNGTCDEGQLVAILARIVRRIVAEEENQSLAPRSAPQRESMAA